MICPFNILLLTAQIALIKNILANVETEELPIVMSYSDDFLEHFKNYISSEFNEALAYDLKYDPTELANKTPLISSVIQPRESNPHMDNGISGLFLIKEYTDNFNDEFKGRENYRDFERATVRKDTEVFDTVLRNEFNFFKTNYFSTIYQPIAMAITIANSYGLTDYYMPHAVISDICCRYLFDQGKFNELISRKYIKETDDKSQNPSLVTESSKPKTIMQRMFKDYNKRNFEQIYNVLSAIAAKICK